MSKRYYRLKRCKNNAFYKIAKSVGFITEDDIVFLTSSNEVILNGKTFGNVLRLENGTSAGSIRIVFADNGEERTQEVVINGLGDLSLLTTTAKDSLVSAVNEINELLNTKAPAVHTHEIEQVNGLENALSEKANIVHSHNINDVTNLQNELNAKASKERVDELEQEIEGKAPLSHIHTIAQVQDLQTALNEKANKETTLEGYGITDAKIENGTITLGENTITPITEHQDISGKADKANIEGNTKCKITYNSQGIVTNGDNLNVDDIPTIPISKIDNLQNELNSKASSEHTHNIEQVTNLQSELNNKAPLSPTTDKNNPQNVSKSQVGLGNVDNTSDSDKPISTATQQALNDKADTNHTHTMSQVNNLENEFGKVTYFNVEGNVDTTTTRKYFRLKRCSNTTFYKLVKSLGFVTENDIVFIRNTKEIVIDNITYGNVLRLENGDNDNKGTIKIVFADNGEERVETAIVSGLGIFSNLTTTNKDTLVDAINEINASLQSKATTEQIEALETEIQGKANIEHTHTIPQVENLETELQRKANVQHTHNISDVTNLQSELNDKASLTHTHDYRTLTNLPNIPTKVSQLENDKGFTANEGTITRVKMNGNTIATSGIADLGTVITEHQDISGKLDKNSDIVGATKCKITYDNKGLVLSGDNLTENDIPAIPISKVNTLADKLNSKQQVSKIVYGLTAFWVIIPNVRLRGNLIYINIVGCQFDSTTHNLPIDMHISIKLVGDGHTDKAIIMQHETSYYNFNIYYNSTNNDVVLYITPHSLTGDETWIIREVSSSLEGTNLPFEIMNREPHYDNEIYDITTYSHYMPNTSN